jgi:HK97 family phage portal protein
MNARALIARVIGPLVAKATEGAFRPGPYYLPLSGGWLPDGAPLNFWQLGMDPSGTGQRSAMVEACISAYAQTVAMCPGDHWRSNDKGGRDRVNNSALSRILRKPNDYQSISDFLLNATRYLYLEGNAYALALRNSRFEVDSLHLMDSRQCTPQLAVNGEIFYHLAGNDIIARRLELGRIGNTQLIVPQRDVLHIRLHTTDHKFPFPLKGETPLMAALADIAQTDAIKRQQIQFYINQARPSAVLSTDLVLNREQVDELRQRWNEQAKGLDGCGPGGTPILTAGLKVQPWTTPGKDAQVAEVMKLSGEQIALAFRIPLQVLGLSGGAPFSSTEALMQFWIGTGLGFALNHIEEAFGQLFQLKGQPHEYLELDTSALLRSQFRDRIEALTRGVQGGVFSPNEARNREGLDSVDQGDEPRVQQQVVPLSAAAGLGAKPTSSGPHPPAAPAPPPSPPAPPPKDYDENVRRLCQTFLHTADTFAGRLDL